MNWLIFLKNIFWYNMLQYWICLEQNVWFSHHKQNIKCTCCIIFTVPFKIQQGFSVLYILFSHKIDFQTREWHSVEPAEFTRIFLWMKIHEYCVFVTWVSEFLAYFQRPHTMVIMERAAKILAWFSTEIYW